VEFVLLKHLAIEKGGGSIACTALSSNTTVSPLRDVSGI
jgi:hypothetical protein